MAPRDHTAKLAKALWSDEALELKPAEFQSRFDSLYATAEGLATYWQLGGAANDYLRRHPGAIAIPVELPLLLLASRLVDGRIIGLKLLNRCSSDLSLVCSQISTALGRKSKHELYGGLFELSNLLDRLSLLSMTHRSELLLALSPLRSHRDTYIRDCAHLFTDWLESSDRESLSRKAPRDP